MKKWAGKKKNVLISGVLSFCIAGIYFMFIYMKIPFIYDINDDVAMRNVASGVITGVPDGHLLHIKYLLGFFISSLYQLIPGFDWYGLVLIGIILFSFSMILYRGLVEKKGVIWKFCYIIISLLLFVCLGLQHITAFQWTVTAAIAGSAGIYLFYTSNSEDGLQNIVEEGVSIFLLLLALLVRDDVFLMLCPIAVLCFWWKYGSLDRKRKWPFVLEHSWILITMGAGIFFIMIVEAFAYSSPEWREFRSYNTDREMIMDYYDLPNYETDPEYYDSLGFTPEEVENIQRYSLYLTENLYSEGMKELARYSKEVYLKQYSFQERAALAVRKIYEHIGKETYNLTNLFALCMIMLVIGLSIGKNGYQLRLIIFILSLWGAYWMYLGYRNRILERVGFALYLLIFMVMLAILYRSLFLGKQEQKKDQGAVAYRAFSVAGICIVLLLIGSMTFKNVKANNTWRRDYNLEFLDVNRYMAEHMENVYFMTTFSIETYTDNFTIKREFAFSNLLSVGGWHTFSPLENKKNEKLSITDPKRDIIQKNNVYLISLENVGIGYIDRYYTMLYGAEYQGRKLVDELIYGERIFEVYSFN
ncbi:MAG: hypothetical protein HFI28_00155 [Lachnospiraceae bacterium]|nr:hypothetical protein [Lachnospiraceae bacterium]